MARPQALSVLALATVISACGSGSTSNNARLERICRSATTRYYAIQPKLRTSSNRAMIAFATQTESGDTAIALELHRLPPASTDRPHSERSPRTSPGSGL